jgi:hypothetical protein
MKKIKYVEWYIFSLKAKDSQFKSRDDNLKVSSTCKIDHSKTSSLRHKQGNHIGVLLPWS